MTDSRKYVLLDFTIDRHPAVMEGTKAEMQEELEKAKAKDPLQLDRYDIMPYDVYELAFGTEWDERF